MAQKKTNPAPPPSNVVPSGAPTPDQLREVETMYKQAGGLIVSDQDGSEFAQDLLTKVKKKAAALDEQRKVITRKLDSAKKDIMDLFDKPIVILQLIVKDISRKVIAYDDQVRAAAAEAQRKLDAEAEAQRQRDLKLADKAAARGDDEKAAQFIERAEMRVAPVVEHGHTPLKGRAFVESYDYEMLDESKLKREYLMPDSNKIGRLVRSLRNKKAAQEAVGEGAIRVTSSKDVRG